MNHDYTHCADFQKSCPKDCFRAQLERDLLEHHALLLAWRGVSYSHLKGTEECKIGGDQDDTV